VPWMSLDDSTFRAGAVSARGRGRRAATARCHQAYDGRTRFAEKVRMSWVRVEAGQSTGLGGPWACFLRCGDSDTGRWVAIDLQRSGCNAFYGSERPWVWGGARAQDGGGSIAAVGAWGGGMEDGMGRGRGYHA